MSQGDRFGAALAKLAGLASIHRTRQEDARRLELRGGTSPEVYARREVAIARLERAVEELERAL